MTKTTNISKRARIDADSRLAQEALAESSDAGHAQPGLSEAHTLSQGEHEEDDDGGGRSDEEEDEGVADGEIDGLVEGMDSAGFSGTTAKVVKPLTPAALAEFQAAQERTGIIYISRIPPGMQPPKVRHLMSLHGEVGRVYLQREDPKRAYLRRKYTSTKKPHYTEGWVEFKDKRVARSVAAMLNAQPIGGKKGSRWRDDIWTMKYLPKFKWNMLTEQVAHEAATHTAQLRLELTQSKAEQRDYLRNVELARVLEKRAKRKGIPLERVTEKKEDEKVRKRPKTHDGTDTSAPHKHVELESVLENIF